MLGTLFQESACQHKTDNHDRCIVIGVPRHASCSPEAIAPKGVEAAEDKRNTGGECHKGVHIGGTVQELSSRITVETPSAVTQIEQRDDEHHLVFRIAVSHRNITHCHQHDHEGKAPREQGLSQDSLP